MGLLMLLLVVVAGVFVWPIAPASVAVYAIPAVAQSPANLMGISTRSTTIQFICCPPGWRRWRDRVFCLYPGGYARQRWR